MVRGSWGAGIELHMEWGSTGVDPLSWTPETWGTAPGRSPRWEARPDRRTRPSSALKRSALSAPAARSPAVARDLGCSPETLRQLGPPGRRRRRRAATGLTSDEREELSRLRRREPRPRAGTGDPGKSSRLLRQGDRPDPVAVFRLRRAREGALSRSPRCAACWTSPPAATTPGDQGPHHARSRADACLAQVIGEIHTDSRGTYGAPRIHAELRLDHRIFCSPKAGGSPDAPGRHPGRAPAQGAPHDPTR